MRNFAIALLCVVSFRTVLAQDENSSDPQLPIVERPAAVKVTVRYIEISRTELDKRDSLPYGGKKGASLLKMLDDLAPPRDGRTEEIVHTLSDPKLVALLDAMSDARLAQVVSKRTLQVVPETTTFVRRDGSAHELQCQPLSDTMIKSESGVEIIAVRLSCDRVRLVCRLEVEWQDWEKLINSFPAECGRRSDHEIAEAAPGQTFALGPVVGRRGEAVVPSDAHPGADGKALVKASEPIETIALVTLLGATNDNAKPAGTPKPTAR